MIEAYIVSAKRTPLGRFGGILSSFSPVELGAHAIKAAIAQAGISPEALDLYILGNVLRAGHGQLLPRQAALLGGIPATVNGYGVDMVCASGMIALINATTAIRAKEADLVLAGGMESMSQTGFFLSHRSRWGYKSLLGTPEMLTDLLVCDGLTDPINKETVGEQTERLAAEYGFSRKELDEVALYSQARTVAATERGAFKHEIAPIEVKRNKVTQVVDTDEGIRPDTALEALGKLRPAFREDGVLTAGNSSQISDGAAALIVASSSAVEDYGLKPIAKILGGTWYSSSSWRFAEASIYAVKKLLEKLDMRTFDFDLFEHNEAFAVSNLLFNTMLGVPHEKLNVNGGAIALGHPIGASGARIVVTLLNALIQQDKTLGMAAICHGMGGGTAIAVERV